MSEIKLDPRKLAIEAFYRDLLGREMDSSGVEAYVEDRSLPIEVVYMLIYSSDEAVRRRKDLQLQLKKLDGTFPITLAMIAKDCEDSVVMAINSIKSIVREVVVLDTGSTDNTASICRGLGARVYRCQFSDFGNIRTIAAHLARQEWVFMLDADETILQSELHLFGKIIDDKAVDIIGLPRKRWADLEMTEQVEDWAYPDWQYRLFRNKPEIFFKRRVHELIDGSKRRKECPDGVGPTIQHFQDVFKRGNKLIERNKMYRNLYNEDVAEGIRHEGSPVEQIDDI